MARWLLSYGSQAPLLQQAVSLVVACELLVEACVWDLVPGPAIEPGPPALGARSLNHCANREVPTLRFLYTGKLEIWDGAEHQEWPRVKIPIGCSGFLIIFCGLHSLASVSTTLTQEKLPRIHCTGSAEQYSFSPPRKAEVRFATGKIEASGLLFFLFF